jgi:hypothetical protein
VSVSPFWVVVGVSVGLRLAVAGYLGNGVAELPGIADQLSYHTLATRVSEGHGFSFGTGWWPATPAGQPTAHWSYLYVLSLAGLYSMFGPLPLVARLAQAVIVGVLQPLLTYRIARRLFGPRAALIAGALVAGYAYFVYYAGALMTESVGLLALLWAIDIAMRLAATPRDGHRRFPWPAWVQLGLALAAAALLRQTMLLVAPLILGWLARELTVPRAGGRGDPAPWRHVAGGVAVTTLVLAACVAPATIRNYRVFHEFVPINTNAGFAFFWGNHPIHGARFIPILAGDGTYGRLIPDELRGLNEARMDKALLRRGVAFVVEDPARYARLSLSRTREYFKFWPSRDSSTASNLTRVFSFGLCLPFMAYGILLAVARPRVLASRDWLRARSGVWLVLGVAGAYTAVHLLTWTLVRYRLPVDALLLPFAGLALADLLDRADTNQHVGKEGPGTPASA